MSHLTTLIVREHLSNLTALAAHLPHRSKTFLSSQVSDVIEPMIAAGSLKQALELIVKYQKASISAIDRRANIGPPP